MATTPNPFFFPTTAPAYEPATVFSPPPFVVGAPANGHHIFPSAATYPYPPSAPAYRPAASFSSNWPTWPPPSPDPAPSTVPPTSGSFPAPAYGYSTSPFPFFYSAPSHFPYAAADFPAPPCGFSPAQPYGPSTFSSAATYPYTPESRVQPPQNHVSSPPVYQSIPNAASRAQQNGDFMEDDAAVQAEADERVSAKDAIRHCLQREVLNIEARFEEQQAHDRTSLDTIQGSSSATTHDALQVFAEIPQPYGFHNLNRRTVFRADGTEHSNNALPANYPLERATTGPVFDVYDDESDHCSTGFVDVFVGTLEQQKYAAEHQESDQFAKCFHKTSENAFSKDTPVQVPTVYDYKSDGYSNEFVHVITDTLQTYEDEQNGGCEAIKCFSKPIFSLETPIFSTADSFVTWSSQLNSEHSMRELRLLWDPGASVPLLSSKTRHPGQALQPARHATTLAGSSVTRFSGCKWLPFGVQNDSYVSGRSEIGTTPYTSWDPGVLNIIDMMLDKYAASHQVQFVQLIAERLFLSLASCMQYTAPNGINSVLHATSLILPKVTNLTQDNYLCSLYCDSVPKTSYVFYPEVKIFLHRFLDILTILTGIDRPWAATHIPDLTAWPNQSVRSAVSIWDPGIGIPFSMYHSLGSLTAATEKYVPSLQTLEPVPWESQVTSEAYVWDTGTLLLQYKFIWLLNVSMLRDGELPYMPQATSSISSEWITYWTSTTSNLIRSFEYGYTMDCLKGHRVFLHQQCVQKNYNAKNLLSSQSYLPISEIDIMFITFRPP